MTAAVAQLLAYVDAEVAAGRHSYAPPTFVCSGCRQASGSENGSVGD